MNTIAVRFSPAFGALMVAAAASPGDLRALVVLGLAAAAVVAGVFVRPASVAAVLLTIVGIALGDLAPLFAAVSGLAATAYLLARYSGDAMTLTTPSMVGMVGFTLVGAVATSVPVRLTWVPLLAPAIMAAILIVVVVPLIGQSFSRPGVKQEPPG